MVEMRQKLLNLLKVFRKKRIPMNDMINDIYLLSSVYDTSLWKKLDSNKNKNAKILASNIPLLCKEAVKRMELAINYFPEYTLHNKTHLLRVTGIMALILGENLNRLNYVEISLLILAAFFHDIGMVPTEKYYKRLEKDSDFTLFRNRWLVEHQNYNELKQLFLETTTSDGMKETINKRIKEFDRVILMDYLRVKHAEHSGEFFRKQYTKDERLGINHINISDYVAKLCVSHGLAIEDLKPENGFNYDEQISNINVNMPYLAIVLRLADILDFDRERTPDVLYQSIHFTNQISINEWEKHRGVKGWNIKKDNIRFTMQFENPVYENTAQKFIDIIDNELSGALQLIKEFPKHCSGYVLSLPQKIDRTRIGAKDNLYICYDLEFSLSRNEIVELLMKNNLYNNPSLFIRELLQNSADAIRLRKAMFKEAGIDWDDGKITFNHYINSEGAEIVTCSDNGSGMDEYIIKNYFTRVGRSYYQSPEFYQKKEALKKVNADFEPCSQFGIGFMACFMIGDKIQIYTRRDNGYGKEQGKPLIIEINGMGSIISIKEGKETQPVGTTVYIYSRKKPSFFDEWTDIIRLTTALKGYALALEFPINAKCSIKEIKEELTINPTITLYPTALESFEISNIKVYKEKFKETHKDLNGSLKESFLINDKNVPCLSNNEAYWEPKQQGTIKNFVLKKKNGEVCKINHRDFITVCLDGILVAGNPGRPEYNERTLSKLGWRNSNIYSHASCLLDIRGQIKPEITPARIPVETRGLERRTPKWNQINYFVQKTSGKIWNNLSSQIDEKKFTSEEFWKLGVIYSSPFLGMSYEKIWSNLSFPFIDEKENTIWRKLSEIEELIPISIKKDNNFILKDKNNNCCLNINNEFKEWENKGSEQSNLKWFMNVLALLTSTLQIKDKEVILIPKEPTNNNAIPMDDCPTQSFISSFSIEYSDNCSQYLTVQSDIATYNRNHALTKIFNGSRYFSQKTDLQEFIRYFVPGIASATKEANGKEIFKLSRWLKHIGHMYFTIDWTKYPSELSAPYKIWHKDKGEIVITGDTFNTWKKCKYKEK